MLGAIVACGQATPPTEVVVVVTSDMPVPAELTSVEVTVSVQGAAPFAQTYELGSGAGQVPLPLVLGLVSLGDQPTEFRVTAIGRRGASGNPIVERSASSNFVPRRIVRLDLPLLQRCQRVTCAIDETCGEAGLCAGARVPPEMLPPFDPKRYPTRPIEQEGGAPPDASADARAADTATDGPSPTADAPPDVASPPDGPAADRPSDPPPPPVDAPPDAASPVDGPPPAYSVGGTVTGLQGIGLSVRLNLQPALAITANGGFTFPTRLPDGTGYLVSIAAQPVGPAQTCTIGNGIGTVSGGAVTNVTVTCAPSPCPAIYDVSVKGDNNVAEVSFPHQTGGVSPALVVGIAIRDDNGIPNTVPEAVLVSYGNLSLRRLNRQTDNFYQSAELWWLQGPPPGTANITVRLARYAQGWVVAATTVNNAVAAQMPLAGAAAGINNTPAVSVSWSVANDVVLDVLSQTSPPNATPASAQVLQWILNAPPVKGHGSLRAGAPGISMSWTTTGATNWVLMAVPVRTSNPNGCR